MNSIFSAFDAFSAESLGQKLRASFVSAAKKGNGNTTTTTNMLQFSDDSTSTKKKKKKQEQQEGQSSTSKNMMNPTSTKTPRFALELDGLNCFETLVSY